MRSYRNHPLWFAFLLHRVSGLALALFLPAHFYVLGMSIRSPQALDGFLNWAELPLVKFAEFGLVFLLAVHFFGGLRLLALEFLPWSAPQKSLAAGAVAGAFFISGIFLLNAV
ncbi:succinate dehydrogenase, cytochrome b556 subunit [Paracoccus seriniphilus]|uniref:succinate dehydrogenase, cytochrome b556 subunit n=1 Tax=Paracoccus seriniphilus TaxID=184748 RepID=UPI00356AE5E6